MAETDKLMCVKHGGNKINLSNFYMASDVSMFSGIGYIPICKRCLFDKASEYYKKYSDMKKAIYYMCELIDVGFNINLCESAIEKERQDAKRVFQSYMVQYNSLGATNNIQLPFRDGEHLGECINQTIELHENNINISDSDEVDMDTQIFWGSGFDIKDYIFLETELTNWKKTHKCDNQAEITLLKEICIKILEIRRLRESKQSVSKEQKELQELMKTASVDPAKSNAINSGENVDRFGVWLKDIEQTRPAEWWADQEKYKDMDGFLPYIKDYIVRPIKNFFTGTKDFLINGEDLSFADKDGEEDE